MGNALDSKMKVLEGDPPSDVIEVFQKYSNGATHMTADQLLRFIQGGNGGTVEKSKAERIVEQVLHKRKTLTLKDFFQYLFNPDLNPPIGSQVHQDMTAPLSHYFIYTSHNSYLTGDQLISPCSYAPIIEALKRGVRGIELDLWPDSSKGNVVVRHGRCKDLTTQVDLLRCLESIKEHAFDVSPYPVVIALEDHLTPDLQAKVAQMITDTFGEMLFCHESGELKEFPTPESLKNKILISTKPQTEYLEAEEDKRESPTINAYDLIWEGNIIRKPGPAYNNLIAIHPNKPNVDLSKLLEVENDKVKCLSLSNRALGRNTERHQKTIKFTQKNLLRVYPAGANATCSNHPPVFGWLHGAQMIPFNMRGYGRPLWLMHGMFQANGGCGYVKKPEFLMTDGPINEVYNPEAKHGVKTALKVKIYMGDGWIQELKGTHSDIKIQVRIEGAPADEIIRRPVWNTEFTFELKFPEIALLGIELHYNKSDGQIYLPVSELRPGIRAVSLCDSKGCPYKAERLLMKFEMLS